MLDKRICLVTFSNNADHQNVVYSMFDALKDKADVFTIGIKDPKSYIAPHTNNNYYVCCPERPGITKDTFNFKELWKIANIIKQNRIDVIYFESQHIWNALLMAMCPKCKKVVVVHDVIPHDGNRAMILSNYVTCHMAHHVVLRNKLYKETFKTKYHISNKKITCIDLWRSWPQENKPKYSSVFLCFGRIRKYKGFELLEKIIELTPDVKFRIVGDPDEESLEIVKSIKKYENVEVIDKEVSDNEMEEYFCDADWLILPYSTATQSGVVVDAYKFSRPVISFNVGAISEQVENGVTGYLIEKGNVKAFSEKLKEISLFPNNKLEKFCHDSYEFGFKKYSVESASECFCLMIQKLL